MSEDEPRGGFRRLWGEIRDLESAQQLLEWDQETTMPPAGAAARGRVLATLASLPALNHANELLHRAQNVDQDVARIAGSSVEASLQAYLEPLQQRDRVIGQPITEPLAPDIFVAANHQRLGASLQASPARQLIDIARFSRTSVSVIVVPLSSVVATSTSIVFGRYSLTNSSAAPVVGTISR